MDKMKIGLVGCGNISDVYFQNCAKCNNLEIVACCDIIPERAKEKADQYNIPKVMTLDELVSDPEIEVVLNLTTPQNHAEIQFRALDGNKHVYNEKPLAINVKDGKKIIDKARKKNLYVGCAPDTFLGGRMQTIRKSIDDGKIGNVIAAHAFCAFHGHEVWHPDPHFFYKTGAGPMLDMGVYYVTALVSLLGPVKKVVGINSKSFPERTITSEPKKGEKISVEISTHVNGLLEFENGVIGNIIASFDLWDPHLPRLEIFGSEGTISINDADPYGGPNVFGGEILYRNGQDSDWTGFPSAIPRKEAMAPWDKIPTTYDYNENSRGVGLAEMADAIQKNRVNRGSGEMMLHVLEIMSGILDSYRRNKFYTLTTTCSRPELMVKQEEEFKF